MSNIVVRGLATDNSLVTAGLGPDLGQRFLQAVSGILSPFGTLFVQFIEGKDAKTNSSGVSIDIDIGTD